jgi:hypothetical protein
MAIHDQYTREIADELGYLATWFPSVHLAPGDVCTLHGREVRRVGDLTEYDVVFEVEERPVETDIEYRSTSGVDVTVKLKGQPPPTGSALALDETGVAVTFARSSGVLMRLEGCTGRRIRSPRDVGDQVLALHRGATWDRSLCVVVETVQSGSSTIVISNAAGATLDLVTGAHVGVQGLTVASAEADFQVKRESDIGARFVAAPGLTPLARVSAVRRPVLGLGETTFRGPEDRDGPTFAAVDYDDPPD